MADGGRAIPQAKADDNEDVSWALSTADAMWNRGELADAIKWVRRAAEAASDAELDMRALELAKAAADLSSQIAGIPGNTAGSQRPPPLAGGIPQPVPPRASASVTPPPPNVSSSSSSAPRRPSNAPPRPSGAPAAGPQGSQAPSASPSRPSPARASVPAPAPSQAPQPSAARRVEAPRIGSVPPAAKSSRPRPAAGTPPLASSSSSNAMSGPTSQRVTALPSPPSHLLQAGPSGQMDGRSAPGERTIADYANLSELDNPDDTQQVVVPVGPPRATRRPRPPDPTPPGMVMDSGYDPTHTQEQRSVQHPVIARQPSAAEIDAWPTQAVNSEETEAGLAALVAKLPPMRKREPSRQPMDPDLLATQAVRVVVWRTADGVRVAPAGTVVSAIACDAVLVALDPTADLSAWLTNKP